MSTRCQIGFYEQGNNDLLKPDALLYRHSDGYPGTPDGAEPGVLADLVPFLKLFHQRRGLDDTEYAAGWTMHHLVQSHVEHMIQWRKEMGETDDRFWPADGRNCIGYGICKDFHGDIEFYYAVQGPTLKVYRANPPFEGEIKEEHFKLIQTIQIDKEEPAPQAPEKRKGRTAAKPKTKKTKK